jgi:uncharacterized protein
MLLSMLAGSMKPTLDNRFFVMCSVELGLGVLALILGYFVGIDPRILIPRWNDFAGVSTGMVVGGAAGVVLAGIVMSLGRLPIPAFQDLSTHTAKQLMSLLSGFTIPHLLVLALSAGIGEELLFRGLLMQQFTGDMSMCSFQEIALAIVLSSLIFGFAHPISRIYVGFATVMGIVMGGLYWYFDNLLVPIVAHWIYDAIMMIWLVKQKNSAIK